MAFAHDAGVPDAFWLNLLEEAQAAKVPLESFGREQTGKADFQQYECRFAHTDATSAGDALYWLANTMPALAKAHQLSLLSFEEACANQVYNGLHWHMHLMNAENQYCFFKRDDEMSAPLACSLGGLLETMPALMSCFAPQEVSYTRLRSGADHIPRTLSWGGNNRTCALRLPESVVPHRHIEHRVSGADADPFASLWALLVGVHYGLSHAPELPAQCFADANREALPLLPMSLEEAAAKKDEASWLKDYV